MIPIKNIIKFFLLVSILFVLVSCSSVEKNETDSNPVFSPSNEQTRTDIQPSENNDILKIPYDFEEGNNPYLCKSSSNRFVNGLIYRSMIDLKSTYEYRYDLISSIETEDCINWYIHLDEGLFLPDDSEFTAYDLKYSLQCAMSENSYYSSSLNIISSYSIVNAYCLKISLIYANRYFPNLLYFPVIKYGTLKNPVYFPDRYDFSENGNYLISCNENNKIQKIELCAINDKSLLTYEMRMGKYDCIYVSDPLSVGTSAVGAIAGLQSNRMVYIGLNSSYGYTHSADFRKAISSAIDYERIVSEIYLNYASIPKGIYNPDFYENQYMSNRTLDLMSSSLILDEMGYNKYDNDGYRLNSRGKRLSLDLLVCSDNKSKIDLANSISEMIGKAGIEVSINALPYSSYLSSLQNGNYDLYIAEVRLDTDMDISKLITPNVYKISNINYIDYGMPESEPLYLKYIEYMSGNCSIYDFTANFNESMPYIPICFIKTCAIFSRDKTYSINGTAYDMFYNIEEWH